jgi:hypothetical protein
MSDRIGPLHGSLGRVRIGLTGQNGDLSKQAGWVTPGSYKEEN